jgi:hypothetical protein
MWGTIQDKVWYIYLYISKLCYVQCIIHRYFTPIHMIIRHTVQRAYALTKYMSTVY